MINYYMKESNSMNDNYNYEKQLIKSRNKILSGFSKYKNYLIYHL